MKEGTFEFPLPKELMEQLRAYAKERDLSMAQVARQALRELMSKES